MSLFIDPTVDGIVLDGDKIGLQGSCGCCPEEHDCCDFTCALLVLNTSSGTCLDFNCLCAYPVPLPVSQTGNCTWSGTGCDSDCYDEPPSVVIEIEDDVVTVTVTSQSGVTILTGAIVAGDCQAIPLVVQSSSDTECVIDSGEINFSAGDCTKVCPCDDPGTVPCALPTATVRTWTVEIGVANVETTILGAAAGCDCTDVERFFNIAHQPADPLTDLQGTEFDVLGCASRVDVAAGFNVRCFQGDSYRIQGEVLYRGDNESEREQSLIFDQPIAADTTSVANLVALLEAGVDLVPTACVVDPPIGDPLDPENRLLCDFCTADITFRKLP